MMQNIVTAWSTIGPAWETGNAEIHQQEVRSITVQPRKWKIQLAVKRASAQRLSQNESGASHAGISLPDGNGAQNTQVVILVIIATFQSLGTAPPVRSKTVQLVLTFKNARFRLCRPPSSIVKFTL